MKNVKNVFKKIFTSNGIFSKILVIFCIGYCVRVIEWSMDNFEMTGNEASVILTGTLGLFGSELAMLLFKRIFGNKSGVDNNNEIIDSEVIDDAKG